MAYSRRLESRKIRLVRQQLGALIDRFHRESFAAGEAELHETFELCMIQGDSFPLQKDAPLSTAVKRLGTWQHLVKSKGKPIGIAHSAAPGTLENDWSVQNFFISPMSKKLARAVAKIDKERLDEDIEVTLVTVPSKSVDFFLLRGPKSVEVYLIAAPDRTNHPRVLSKADSTVKRDLLRFYRTVRTLPDWVIPA
jgi:hypothetical protein